MMIALGVSPNSHRRVMKDMRDALDLVSLFSTPLGEEFLDSSFGEPFRKSLLLRQIDRAEFPPDRRTPNSNVTRPKQQFKELDDSIASKRHELSPDQLPKHWDVITRPIIACLYREGVLCTVHDFTATGPAICITEPDRPGKPDLFFDWRVLIPETRLPPYLVDPRTIGDLVDHAKEFAKKRPDAKFSVIRIWSAPHFWPLMLGPENRENTSFFDSLGRIFHWKFVPKDMPHSEWSIHKSVSDRFDPFRDFFFPSHAPPDGKSKVVVRKDTILVMGADAETCRRMTIAAVFAVSTRPWRLEVDPWKSWFNVDLGFLLDLNAKWWE